MERYFAIRVGFDFKISLPLFLQNCISWLAEQTLDFHQHVLKLPWWFCLKCVTIAAVVHFDWESPSQQAGSYVFKLCLPYDVDACEFGLLHYFFVDVQGAEAGQVLYSAIRSLLSEVFGNPQFIAVIVDLISSVYIMHPSFA